MITLQPHQRDLARLRRAQDKLVQRSNRLSTLEGKIRDLVSNAQTSEELSVEIAESVRILRSSAQSSIV